MKDIKTLAIGFLSCACLLLIMGQTKPQSSEPINVSDGKNWVTIEKDGISLGSLSDGVLKTSTYDVNGFSLFSEDINDSSPLGIKTLIYKVDGINLMIGTGDEVYSTNWKDLLRLID